MRQDMTIYATIWRNVNKSKVMIWSLLGSRVTDALGGRSEDFLPCSVALVRSIRQSQTVHEVTALVLPEISQDAREQLLEAGADQVVTAQAQYQAFAKNYAILRVRGQPWRVFAVKCGLAAWRVDPESLSSGSAWAEFRGMEQNEVIDVEVITLQGKRFKVSDVPISMLGRDLRRMICERLPGKTGAHVVVQHGSSPLSLNQTLVQQGIVEGGCVSLTCVYVPVNVAAAWRFLKGYQVDEEEFSLHGVTQLEGIQSADQLMRLPNTLKSLAFADGFADPLDLNILPSSLQSLTLPDEFDQSLDHVNLPSGLRNLTFGQLFNHRIDHLTLPSSLQDLTFGWNFNQSLDHVEFPGALQRLSLRGDFNQSMDQVKLPRSLLSLHFSPMFNHSMDHVNLPTGLQSLTFGTRFNQSLEPEHLPSGLQKLTLGGRFDKTLDQLKLPASLQSLTFGAEFNQPIDESKLPRLQSLTFGDAFDQHLALGNLPSSLKSLSFGDEFNQPLDPGVLPNGLQHLAFGKEFNQPMEQVNLPSELQSLVFGDRFNQAVSEVQWPSGLKTLTFGSRFNQQLSQLPQGLQSLTFGNMFNRTLDQIQLPDSLETLILGTLHNIVMESVVLPSGLRHLSFGHGFTRKLDGVKLPPGPPKEATRLQSLSFGALFVHLGTVNLPNDDLELQRNLVPRNPPTQLEAIESGLPVVHRRPESNRFADPSRRAPL
eukprot:s370_g23.t1